MGWQDLSVPLRRCQRQRLGDCDVMEAAITAWAVKRSAVDERIGWQATSSDVRTKKLRCLSLAYGAETPFGRISVMVYPLSRDHRSCHLVRG